MMSAETYFADIAGLGTAVDILPYAKDVVSECPYPHDLTAIELADLTVTYAAGKYIKVDIEDRVAGRMLGSMIRQVIGRVNFEHHRRAQLLDPDIRTRRPLLQLVADKLCACNAAAARTGRFLRDDELGPLPLSGCWGHSCFCSYTTERPGATPEPAVQPTFSGIIEIRDDDSEDDW